MVAASLADSRRGSIDGLGRRPSIGSPHAWADRWEAAMARYVIIGGGIIGLATAYRLTQERPGAEVTVVEKEPRIGQHQTGHNSGVIHAGVYYRPGSLKARLCVAGSRSMM